MTRFTYYIDPWNHPNVVHAWQQTCHTWSLGKEMVARSVPGLFMTSLTCQRASPRGVSCRLLSLPVIAEPFEPNPSNAGSPQIASCIMQSKHINYTILSISTRIYIYIYMCVIMHEWWSFTFCGECWSHLQSHLEAPVPPTTADVSLPPDGASWGPRRHQSSGIPCRERRHTRVCLTATSQFGWFVRWTMDE